jgi:hypothetical protein
MAKFGIDYMALYGTLRYQDQFAVASRDYSSGYKMESYWWASPFKK